MSEMPKELKDHYLDEANKHAEFLTEKVFKPAFIMAFIHGVKHGREDLNGELKLPQVHIFEELKEVEDISVFDKCQYCGAGRVVRPSGEWQYYCECDDPKKRPDTKESENE